ncbi:hypothetical protein BMS3Bbin09_00721 [bacterium BMS3Bbin09]|nr:hypothetical protein BMS3Bbin09_00721 [bacterium BMS3Bbin09]
MVFISILLSSCAVINHYPLKNDTYFKRSVLKPYQVVIMPFNVDIYTNYSSTNTLEKREKKARDARKYAVSAIIRGLARSHYKVVANIPYEAVVQDNFDRETRSIIYELFHELNDANFSIQHNLEDEEGKSFDYSIGIRAREIAGLFDSDPDVLVFIDFNAFVRNLRALESSGDNSGGDIMTLGMNTLEKTPEDIIFIRLTLVDADTGDIIWRDKAFEYGRSVLRPWDINYAAKELFKNLSRKVLQQRMSYVK